VALAGLLAALAPGAALGAAPDRMEVSRNIFHAVAERPERTLGPGAPVDVREERWVVRGAARLRIASPEPRTEVVTRFRPDPAGDGALELTVILVSAPRTRDFYYLEQSRLMREGRLEETTAYRLGDGVETALVGAPGTVRRIVIQDDAAAELRLSQAGDLLTLEAVPPAFGGRPTGGARPYYAGKPLRPADGRWRAAGYTDNAYGEVRIGEDFALAGNVFFPDATLWLGRALIRRQATRWEHLAVWLEGGAAAYQEVPQTGEADAVTLTWVFGTAVVYRTGDWGAALRLATVNGPAVVEALGAWQLWPRLGLLLLWQSFEGYSGTAAGIAWDF